MIASRTKRERLLDWIKNGDDCKVPILIGPYNINVIAESYYNKKNASPEQIIDMTNSTGIHLIHHLIMPMPLDIIQYIDNVTAGEQKQVTGDECYTVTNVIHTKEGSLKEISEYNPEHGESKREYYIKDEKDLKILLMILEKLAEVIKHSSSVRKELDEKFSGIINSKRAAMKNYFPTQIHVQAPAMDVISTSYISQSDAIYLLHDYEDIYREVMENYRVLTGFWLEIAAKNNIDIYNYAINGYEWLSPYIYEQFMIPDAKMINDFARQQGKISWIHTCGKMKQIAGSGIYQDMKVDIVESLSTPPSGDITNMAETRAHIGKNIVTRGGINVELFYDDDTEKLVKQTEYILKSVEGFKHMIGDTNPTEAPYPWTNIKAVIDVVKSKGRLFE